MFLWGICVRVVFGLHATWLVNSATHMWGGRRFATRDDSRNNWWVALLTFGEGWHNNHHAHPTSARHGLAWYEFDPSWIMLKILEFFGIAKAIQCAKVESAAGGSQSCLVLPSLRDSVSWSHGCRRPEEIDRILHRAWRRRCHLHPASLRRLGSPQLAHGHPRLFFGVLLLGLIISGVVLNTIFPGAGNPPQ